MRSATVSMTLCACLGAAVGAPFTFVAHGDWGGQSGAPYTTIEQLAAAKAMGTKASEIGARLVLAIGDNFYGEGIPTDMNDKRFNATFESVYSDKSLQVPWYVVAGNHDWKGNVTAQIAYQARSPRWRFPSLWYTFTESFVDDATQKPVTVQFVMIDTVVLSSQSLEIDNGRGREGGSSLRGHRSLGETQLQWIEQTLASSTADWLVVAGHYPVWSIAEHGPTPALLTSLRPLLLKYGVVAYLSGHDHNMQHLSEARAAVSRPRAAEAGELTMDYIVTGAAHGVDLSQEHKNVVPSGVSKFFWPEQGVQNPRGGFAAVAVTASTFSVDIFDQLNSKLHSVSLPNPRRQTPPLVVQ